MDLDIFSFMADLVEGGETYNNEMKLLEEQVARIVVEDPIKPKIDYIMPIAHVPVFDEKYNLSDRNVRDEFVNEKIFDCNVLNLFSDPSLTTSTVQGAFTNVAFIECELIEKLTVDTEILACRSNFGKLAYENYSEFVKSRKTKRGRKKKEKKQKMRKCQGTGDEMNSQITFVIKSTTVNFDDGIMPINPKVYKFKVFRTGKLQLPGVKPADIEDVVECAKILAAELDLVLHAGDDISKRTMLANLNPVMKNYKFVANIPPNSIFILPELKKLMIIDENKPEGERDANIPPHPKFSFKKCTYDKMAIAFRTPTPEKPKKKVKINIFMRGKINILGGLHPEPLKSICTYLHYMLQKHYDKVVGEEHK